MRLGFIEVDRHTLSSIKHFTHSLVCHHMKKIYKHLFSDLFLVETLQGKPKIQLLQLHMIRAFEVDYKKVVGIR